MDKWTLIINTHADVEGNKLLLNDKPVPTTSVELKIAEGQIPQLVVEIPVLEDNLNIEVVKERPADIEVVEAEAVKRE